MIISLVRMPADGLRFHHQYQAGELDLREREFEFEESPLVTGRVDRAGVDIRVRGDIRTKLNAPCDRCLADVVIPVEPIFDLVYTSSDRGPRQFGEIELHEFDLGLATYENDEINLDDLVLEQIELGLPTRVLCREECRGLCPQCGVDLNLEQCLCEKPIDPRWQALADLKAELEPRKQKKK